MFNFYTNTHGVSNSNETIKKESVKQQENLVDFQTLQMARKDLVGEIQAIIEYDDHIYKSNNQVAKKVWTDIKNEELSHVGELLALIDFLEPNQRSYVQKGVNEFNEMTK